jgi:alkylation response protein AidB-like acyl-CoA dehydrogenase
LASEATGPAADRLAALLDDGTLLAVADPAAAGGTVALGGGELQGTLPAVRFAAEADTLLVVAGEDTVAILSARHPGVEVQARPSLDPRTQLCAVTLDGAEVREDELLHAPALDAVRDRMRLMLSWERLGIAAHCLDLAVGYAKERTQFGRPIGSFQAVQHILAEMAREKFGLERLCHEATAAAADGVGRLAIIAATVDAFSADTARRVVEGSLQVHGGIAFTVEHELHLHYKRLLALEGLYGEHQDQWQALGEALLAPGGDASAW